MPTTRLQAAAHPVMGSEGAEPVVVETHLRNALQGVARLRNQIDILTRENTRLKSDIERLYEAQGASIQPKPGKKGNMSVLSLTSQINKLKREVADLGDARRKDRKKIRKLQLKEIKRDALELRGEAENGFSDESEEMKKLLRRFFELMSSPSMEEKEECAVCLCEMTLESAKSLPCQHIFCADCLPNIVPQNCPNCRESFGSVDDAEPVLFTATDQWDALLEVAAAWGRIDKDQSPEDMDQEEELPFIEDEETGSVASGGTSSAKIESAEVEEGAYGDEDDLPSGARSGSGSRIRKMALSTPPPDGDASQSSRLPARDAPSTPTRVIESPMSYQKSPLSVKRQRMKELADARKSKRARR